MQHGHVHAAQRKAGGGFQTQQAAADDDRLFARLRGEQHGVHIVEVAIGDDAGQVLAGNRDDEGNRAGGDHQLVIAFRHAVVGGDGAGVAVDADDAVALVEGHVVFDIPAVAMDDDVLEGLLARENRREHDAVIVDARLGVEDRDVVEAGGLFEEMLQHAAGGHAVADDDEFLGHEAYSAASTKRWRS